MQHLQLTSPGVYKNRTLSSISHLISVFPRRQEIQWVLKYMLVLAFTVCSWYVLRSFILYIIITPYVATDGELSPQITFTTMSMVMYLGFQLSAAVIGMLEFADGVVGLFRISVSCFLN